MEFSIPPIFKQIHGLVCSKMAENIKPANQETIMFLGVLKPGAIRKCSILVFFFTWANMG
jgi:hypothetical protein